MDTTNAHLYLPAVEALRDKELQWMNPSTGKWQDVDYADFNYSPDCYRRRPKPREWWVNIYNDGSINFYKTTADASAAARRSIFVPKPKTIRVREVIE